MKTLFFTLTLILLFVGTAYPVDTWYTANEKSFEWNAVTTINDGEPIPEGSTITYRVHMKDEKTGNYENKAQFETPNTQATIVLPEGEYRVGVRTLRYVDGVLVSESKTISWSDDTTRVQGGETFGFRFYGAPADSMGLRLPE